MNVLCAGVHPSHYDVLYFRQWYPNRLAGCLARWSHTVGILLEGHQPLESVDPRLYDLVLIGLCSDYADPLNIPLAALLATECAEAGVPFAAYIDSCSVRSTQKALSRARSIHYSMRNLSQEQSTLAQRAISVMAVGRRLLLDHLVVPHHPWQRPGERYTACDISPLVRVHDLLASSHSYGWVRTLASNRWWHGTRWPVANFYQVSPIELSSAAGYLADSNGIYDSNIINALHLGCAVSVPETTTIFHSPVAIEAMFPEERIEYVERAGLLVRQHMEPPERALRRLLEVLCSHSS